MSRSRKKVPGYTDYSRGCTKYAKRCASKAVRRVNNSYFEGECSRNVKRFYNPWDIRDWIWLEYNVKSVKELFEMEKKSDSDYVKRSSWRYETYSDEKLLHSAVKKFMK